MLNASAHPLALALLTPMSISWKEEEPHSWPSKKTITARVRKSASPLADNMMLKSE